MSALSLGYRTTAGWVVDLAWRFINRYPESPNPLAEPAVVLIDEIDLHLHPRWQLRIMKDLSFAVSSNAVHRHVAQSPNSTGRGHGEPGSAAKTRGLRRNRERSR